MERDPLADSEKYETDEEIREQPAWSEPNIRPESEPSGGDWTVTEPFDDHGHGDVNDKQAQKRKRKAD